MNDLIWRSILVMTALAAALPFATEVWAQEAPAAPDATRARALVHLVRQDCGACHGLTLKGGLGPALTPEALRERPFDAMVTTVLEGRPTTPMPPFRGLLKEHEVVWIMQRLYAGFPADGGPIGASAERSANAQPE